MVTTRYLLNRTFQAVLTLFAVISFTFVLIRWMPGGPRDYLMNILLLDPDISPREMEYMMETYLGFIPDDPLHVQYYDYMTGLLQGNLGTSIWYQRPVAEIVAEAMPWTVYLSAVSLVLTFMIGIGLGAVMAYKEKSNFDVGMTIYSIVIQAFPYYVFAVLLLWIFSYQGGWFPVGSRYGSGVNPGFNVGFIGSVLYHSVLPVASLVIIGFGGTTLGMRANSIRVLGEDYIRVAQLRGLTERRIAMLYVGRNAILPMYTGLMISMGSLFGGSVILETLFNYPGMGYYMFEATMARDYPLLMGGFLFITVGVIVGVFLADLSYGYVDPRAGTGSSRESFAGELGRPHVALVRWARRLVKRVIPNQSGEQLEANGHGLQSASGGARSRTTEGGNSPFVMEAEGDYSLRKRLYRLVDMWIFAPARILWNDWRARIGVTIILVYIFAGTVGVVITEPPKPLDHPGMAAPFESWAYPLGTEAQGRSIFHQLIHATPTMFKMMIGGAVYGTGMAAIWGFFSGYVGGKVDRVMMTIADILITIPGLPLVIVIAALLEPRNPFVVGLIVSINGWAGASRNWRSQVLSVRSQSYVEASRTMGLSTIRIVTKDIGPNMAPLMMIRFVSLTRSVISASVALYFLGILPFTTLNWGVMLNAAYDSGTWFTMSGVHWLLAPVVTIVLLSFGLILLGQACDHIFNPRIRARHQKTVDDEDETATMAS